MTFWTIWIWPLVQLVALVILGLVLAPRAGAARGRLWLGLGLMIAAATVSLIWSFIYPSMVGAYDFDARAYGVIAATVNIASTVLGLVGVGVLASAATVGRGPSGQLDPGRPGAPPSGYGTGGYQGTGYPPAGGSTPGPSSQGNPYA